MGTLRVRRLPRPSTSLERTLTTANLTRELACRERLSSSKSTKSTKPFGSGRVWSGLVGSDLSFFFSFFFFFFFLSDHYQDRWAQITEIEEKEGRQREREEKENF